MNPVFLAQPSPKYHDSFCAYVHSYQKSAEEAYIQKYQPALTHFSDYIETLRSAAEGKNLPEGHVPCSTFWLIAGETVVGVVRIRHQEVWSAGHIGYDISPAYRNKGYGSKILELALIEASKLGLKEVILTCNVDNAASRKIIEKNNGVFLDTIFDEDENEHLHRFRISLPQ